MAEWWVPDIMSEACSAHDRCHVSRRGSLWEVIHDLAMEGPSKGSPDLGDLQAMGESRVDMVIGRQRVDLRFAAEPPEGAGVDRSVGISLKGASVLRKLIVRFVVTQTFLIQ